MPKLLILGGDGFVGKAFIDMQSKFDDVRIVSRSVSFPGKEEHVVADLESLPSEIFDGVDIVFNCLGIAHKKDSTHKNLFFQVNRDLAINLAEKAKALKVKTFVQMSSISVYGPTESIDINTPLSPTTNYGKSKAEADKVLQSLDCESFRVLILRPPMLYGVGAPGNMAKLIGLVNRLPVLPFKHAEETREFLCIGNFVKLVEYALQYGIRGVLLLKDVRGFSTKCLVQIITEELRLKRILIDLPLPWLVKELLPDEFQKLFGPLKICSNLKIDPDALMGLFDQELALRQMIRTYQINRAR